MHFPIPAKTWINYSCPEKVFKHDMQLHQTVDLKTESTDRWDPGAVTQRVSHAAHWPIFGRPALADGEVSGHGVSTGVLPAARRT